MNPLVELSPNRLVQALQKLPSEFRRADIIRFVKDHDIRMVNFMYPAADTRLKTLNFTINSLQYLEQILTYGERVDGSSLFPFIDAAGSDLYVIPRYSTAFVDPFAEVPTLTMLASFFDAQGRPLASSPEQTLRKATQEFKATTGLDFYAMGELEYYVISTDNSLFPARDQRGYHESAPFAKHGLFRQKCMQYIAQAGGQIKYGHSEVGNFSADGRIYEQNEIEFLPVPALEAADQLMIAKWIIRTLAAQMDLDITFAPKITAGKAGSGLHIHFKLMDGDRNVMADPQGRLTPQARKAIAGILTLAPSLTAFGNKVPTSYLRLVPHQEAPTNICWGDRNRSVLVRVPLGWTSGTDMCAQANPLEAGNTIESPQKQTAELRSADCSADIYQLLAGMATAARYGFEMPDALQKADQMYVDVNIHRGENASRLASLASLPDSCVASAQALDSQRHIYEAHGVFSPAMIDGIIASLKAHDDETLRSSSPQDILQAVARHWHCG